MKKNYYTLQEAADYLSEALDDTFTEDEVLYLGENHERHFPISIHCYVRKNFADFGGFYYPNNENYSYLQSNNARLCRNLGLKGGVVRGGHSEASNPVNRLLSDDCKANLKNLRLDINEEGFESFDRKELCVEDFVLEKYIRLVRRYQSIHKKTKKELSPRERATVIKIIEGVHSIDQTAATHTVESDLLMYLEEQIQKLYRRRPSYPELEKDLTLEGVQITTKTLRKYY